MTVVEPGEFAAVEVVTRADDVKVLRRSLARNQPHRLHRYYLPLRGAAFIGMVGLATIEPVAWFFVGLESTAVVIEIVLRKHARSLDVLKMSDAVYTLRADGVVRRNDDLETVLRWPRVRVRHANEHFVLDVHNRYGWVLPYRCFESDAARVRFGELLDEYAGTTEGVPRSRA